MNAHLTFHNIPQLFVHITLHKHMINILNLRRGATIIILVLVWFEF